LKIKEAKRLIREGQMNFTEISEFLGFSSIHYFSKLFKKPTGKSPSEYAKQKRNAQ
jgi:YesN/AraC family two-component response regulator